MNYKLVLRLLGLLTKAFAVIVIVPLLVSLAVDHEHIMVFLGTLLISLGVSRLFLYYGTKKTTYRLRIREAMAIVGCGWMLVCFLGALPYLFNGMGMIDSVFESVSGFTTTGVTTVRSFDEFSNSLQAWRCLTHWFGGIGVIMLFIVIMPQMNSGAGHLFNAELPGAVAERTLPRIKESAALIVAIYTGLTVIEIILLMLGGVGFYQAINLALATMATGGFSFYHDSLVSFHSIYVEIVCIAFMLIASMNFSLYYKIFRGDWEAFKNDTEHRYYLGMLVVAATAIAFDLYNAGYMNLTDSLRHGFFQAISIGSTTGFASDDFNNWPSFSRYVLLILMFIGGCSGSTAGGMKVSRVVILLKASWSELLRTLHPRIVYSIKMGGQMIDPAIISNITRFFFLYIIVFMVLTIAISLTGISIMESIGIIATCLSSAGPAFGIVGPTSTYSEISTFGRIVTICAMLLGRLEIFTLLVIMRPDFWRNKQNW